MTSRYKNPPIEEAICEFRFAPSRDWDLTIPGKLHHQIIDEYGGQPKELRVLETTVKTGSDSEAAEIQHRAEIGKLLLVNNEGTRMVGVGPDVMSVHMLRPYQNSAAPETSGWDEFRPRIEKAIKAYWGVANPRGVSRIGVRYINKLVVPKQKEGIKRSLKKLVECTPPDIHGFPGMMDNLASRFEYTCPDNMKLALSQHLANAENDQFEFFLDIDVAWNTTDEPIDQGAALEKTSQLKDQENKIFEALITNRAREHFDAD